MTRNAVVKLLFLSCSPSVRLVRVCLLCAVLSSSRGWDCLSGAELLKSSLINNVRGTSLKAKNLIASIDFRQTLEFTFMIRA